MIDKQSYSPAELRRLTGGIPEKTVTRELDRFTADYPEIEEMVASSFLSDNLKQTYYNHYRVRLVSFLRQ